jgi:hypothetical protein
MTTPATHEQERRAYAAFASGVSEEGYRARLAALYGAWRRFNAEHFGGRLLEPHLALGRTAPRSLGHCARTTDYGGRVQIALNAGLVFGTNAGWVARPWPPAEGTRRFVEDLLLRLAVRQFALEALGDDEPGYRGFGPAFAREANRVGERLGLAPVVARRRGRDAASPVARGWPHCVRPGGYYLGDVTGPAEDLARGRGGSCRGEVLPTEGLLELLLERLGRGPLEEARRLVAGHPEWLRRYRGSRPGCGDGEAPEGVAFARSWLGWNGGTVVRLAEGIRSSRSYWDLPLLAEALAAAGCRDGRVLAHLREPRRHGRRCWVLRGLLAAGDG